MAKLKDALAAGLGALGGPIPAAIAAGLQSKRKGKRGGGSIDGGGGGDSGPPPEIGGGPDLLDMPGTDRKRSNGKNRS